MPAARYRVRQYVAPLAEQGIAVTEHWPHLGAYPPANPLLRPLWLPATIAERLPQVAASTRANITLLQRELVSTLPTLERLTRRPRFVDIDDSIHLHRGGVAARHLARAADLVVVGNVWLAEIWRRWARDVEILPTAVDTDLYAASPLPEHPVIGWIGTSSNLHYLEPLAPAFAEIMRRVPGIGLAVCSDVAPALGGLPFRFVRWSPESEAPFLASISIGVMPLDDGDWERGKCSLKMLQYAAAARPSVVSPVGMNNDLLAEAEIGLAAATETQWIEALCALAADREAACRMGEKGRQLAVSRYSVRALAPRLASLLRRLV